MTTSNPQGASTPTPTWDVVGPIIASLRELGVPDEALDPIITSVCSGDEDYRIALRPDSDGDLDDVVIKDVSMFRAEDMGETWWLCCYLDASDDRIAFSFDKATSALDVTEYPMGSHTYEKGSIRDR